MDICNCKDIDHTDTSPTDATAAPSSTGSATAAPALQASVADKKSQTQAQTKTLRYDGEYHIQLVGKRTSGGIPDPYLHVGDCNAGDKRDTMSTYVCAHDNFSGEQSAWRLIPAGNNAYHIQLVGKRTSGGNMGPYLHVSEVKADDRRNGTKTNGSTYVCVHDCLMGDTAIFPSDDFMYPYSCVHDDLLGCKSKWRLIPAGNSKYHIQLVGKRTAGGMPGPYLHVWEVEDGDKRDGAKAGGSTYTCVHDKLFGEHSTWRLVPRMSETGRNREHEPRTN